MSLALFCRVINRQSTAVFEQLVKRVGVNHVIAPKLFSAELALTDQLAYVSFVAAVDGGCLFGV